MLFNLLLATITILLCFFFLVLIVFKNFFTNPVVIKNARLQIALMIPKGAPITVAIKALSKYSKEAIYLLRFLFVGSLSLISAIK